MLCSWSGGCGKSPGREVRWGDRMGLSYWRFLVFFFSPSFLESGVDFHPDFPRGSTFRMKRPPKEVLQEGHVSVCIKKTHGNIHVSNINNICTYCHCWTPLNPNKLSSPTVLVHGIPFPPPQTVFTDLVWQPVGSARVVWLIFLTRHPRIQTCGFCPKGPQWRKGLRRSLGPNGLKVRP